MDKEGQERLENLDELINAAASFIDDDGVAMGHQAEGGALVSFLTHASLEAGEHQAGEGQEAVQLMSVHSAKGLEFDVVFITGLEQGLFPHENAVNEGKDGLEEERRLMYVAVTRARQRLYVSCAQTRMLHGQTRYCVPSSFLDEIPENLLLKLNKKAEPAAFPAFGSFGGGYAEPAPSGGLRIGQTVEHAKFGIGVIVSTEGRGDDARLQINFGGSGMKWLALAYAKLTPV
jgi:DNA helicase-2/ATP-dependent DNA helicase PcrA